ncbi:MAG: tRNA preQ1(34) S-adenosylmethionine ribosyltransferase-isomerase QueA [Candidatus Thermoplasmatota archaeon]
MQSLSYYDYKLQKEFIAQEPVERGNSRLMVLGEKIEHKKFSDIIEYLDRGDCLVLNDTKVIKAKLNCKKATGGKVEILVLESNSNSCTCIAKGKVKEGMELFFNGVKALVKEKIGSKIILEFDISLEEIIEKYGKAPLPPYIKKKVCIEDYQTVYAKKNGSIAAPTAGLHFSKELLLKLESKGIKFAFVTLHIGIGTFKLISSENIFEHKMEGEYYSVDEKNANLINETGGKKIAVGTSTIRAIESASRDGLVIPGSGIANIFIYPSYKFNLKTDGLITNFHLPKSTPLLLVCAYAGYEKIMNAYRIAIKEGYRFYSFGDAMFILNYY